MPAYAAAQLRQLPGFVCARLNSLFLPYVSKSVVISVLPFPTLYFARQQKVVVPAKDFPLRSETGLNPGCSYPRRVKLPRPKRAQGCTRAVTMDSAPPSGASSVEEGISCLSQKEAQAIDEELMGPLGFSIDQLMELAGLSVASAIAEVYAKEKFSRVLILCGPGNNGGDGLVAARHLYHFGYKPTVCYPKKTEKPLYQGLVTQLACLDVPFVSSEELPDRLGGCADLVVDALFGFSFQGTPRPPFDAILQKLAASPGTPGTEDPPSPPVVSIDIPSGWHVEDGDLQGTGLHPQMLVSLTAPKKCARKFSGPHHFLGGRFVPPGIVQKYGLRLPEFPGPNQCVRISRPAAGGSVDVASLRLSYTGWQLLEEGARKDPIEQFKEWFEEAVTAGVSEPNAMTLATATATGSPSARIVLMKGYDSRGFVWFTNYKSRKAQELASSGRAALVFFWEPFHRSVRVEGPVEKVSPLESDEYFHSRPRGSQLGALVSPQSKVIAGRAELDLLNEDLLEEFKDRSYIPRPDHWGGFRLRPEVIEFWQGRESRLHDRLRYSREVSTKLGEAATWKVDRLAP